MEKANFYSIQNLPHEERPREKLTRLGVESLSTAELIAIILGSGTKTMPVLELAQQIVAHFGGVKNICEATVEELCQIKGLGAAKALQLKAAFGLGLKLSKQATPPKYKIDHPLHVFHLLKEEVCFEKREIFYAVLLDAKSFVISHPVISVGTLTNALVHPREVFYPAIRHKASHLILAHNHPSGDSTPSKEDIEVTKSLIEAGKLMGIPLQDHIIIGENRYTSLRQQGIVF
jgi:DNA repair protein RadC